MPLEDTTTRYDLCEERDRLDDQLDELVKQSLDLEDQFDELQGRFATLEDDEGDEAAKREYGRLIREQERLEEKIVQGSKQYNGLLWAIDRYGAGGSERVVTDGGAREDADDTDTDAGEDGGKQELYDKMTSTDNAGEGSPTGATASGADQQPQAAASGGQSADDPTQSADSTTASADQQATQPAGAAATNDITIVLGAHTAGERAQVTDKRSDVQAEKSQSVVGGGQAAGTAEGASSVFYCAAGLVDAPFIEPGWDFEQKCKAVREVHPGLMAWMQARIDEVSSPSENLGNGFQQRVSRVRNNREKRNETSPPDTTT